MNSVELRRLDLSNQDSDLMKRLVTVNMELDVIEARRRAIQFEIDLLNELQSA